MRYLFVFILIIILSVSSYGFTSLGGGTGGAADGYNTTWPNWNNSAINFSRIWFNDAQFGNLTSVISYFGFRNNTVDTINLTWPNRDDIVNNSAINFTRIWANQLLFGNKTSIIDYFGWKNNTIDTRNDTFFGDGYNETNQTLANNVVQSVTTNSQYNYCISDGNNMVNCSTKSFLKKGLQNNEQALIWGDGRAGDLVVYFDTSTKDGRFRWQIADYFLFDDGIYLPPNAHLGVGTTPKVNYYINAVTVPTGTTSLTPIFGQNNIQTDGTTSLISMALFGQANCMITPADSNAQSSGTCKGVVTQSRVDNDMNDCLGCGYGVQIVGGDFNADTTASPENYAVKLVTGGKFTYNLNSAGNNNLWKSAWAADFQPLITGTGSNLTITEGGGWKILEPVTSSGNSYGTFFGGKIPDITNANVTGTSYALWIDAQDGAYSSAEDGNVVFVGGDWNTGHQLFGDTNIWANDTYFQIKDGVPTGIGDYDLAVGVDSMVFKGNITSSNVFVPAYLFTHTNDTIPVRGASQWTNITFPLDYVGEPDLDVKFGINHTRNDNQNHTFYIMEDGIYDISYDFDVEDDDVGASDIDVAGRVIYRNGTEISGSVYEIDVTKNAVEVEVSHTFLARLEAYDAIVFQFIADDANIHISTHGTFGVQPESASVVIEKIANLP